MKLRNACGAALLLIACGCIRTPPKTAPAKDLVRTSPAPCAKLEDRLAVEMSDSKAPSEAQAEELLRRFAALLDEPALRDCLATLMVKGPTGSEP